MKAYRSVIQKLLLTEKGSRLQEQQNKYLFRVNQAGNQKGGGTGVQRDGGARECNEPQEQGEAAQNNDAGTHGQLETRGRDVEGRRQD